MRKAGICLNVLPTGNGFIYREDGKEGAFTSFERRAISDLQRSDIITFEIISEDEKCFIAKNLRFVERPTREENSKIIYSSENT